jgi:hypothetical protein
MSMENAIEQHAAALNNLAEALRSAFDGLAALANLGKQLQTGGVQHTTLAAAAESVKAQADEDTKKTRAKAEKAEPLKKDAEVEQAVEKVEADAKKDVQTAPSPADTAAPNTSSPDADSDETPLDYNKDVKPALLAAIKAKGKEAVQALIKSYGVDKADQIDPAQLGDLLAKAKAL